MNTARIRQITIFRNGKRVATGKVGYGLIGAPVRRGPVGIIMADCDDQASGETCDAIGDAIDRGGRSSRQPDDVNRWVVEIK